ncbi:MAG: hypothetical protein RLZZ536_713, partial [Planctomycetota bacterium]
ADHNRLVSSTSLDLHFISSRANTHTGSHLIASRPLQPEKVAARARLELCVRLETALLGGLHDLSFVTTGSRYAPKLLRCFATAH